MTTCLSTLFWTSIAGGLLIGLFKFVDLLNRLEHPRRGLPPAADRFITSLLMAAVGLIAVLLALQCLLFPGATRYEVGATDVTVHSGAFWRRTSSYPLIGITSIDTSSGPLMRLFALTDLHLYFAPTGEPPRQGVRIVPSLTLKGLRDGEEAKQFLLDRRASLHEAAIRGDLMVGNTPHEMQLQRLTDAIERLNARMPRV